MRRFSALLTALAILVVVPGCGGTPQAQQRTTGAAPHDLCEQARAKVLKQHPDAYVADCNSGTGTLPRTTEP